jgi:peptidoglycan/xylan/chitin deacetylase (PgdA/CDA1 family)
VEEVVKQPIDAGYRIYTARPMDRVVALTFDDGPWPETTDQILDVLEQNNAKATFFTIGSQISQYASSVKRANEMGCQICTHTWDHAEGSGQGTNIGYMSASEQVQEVERGYKAIADVLGEEPAHILRAPGGNFNGDTITNLWDYVDAEIGWDVDTEDWRRPGSDSIANMILSVQPGQVILMHDGGGDRSQTVEALREALPQLVEKGYSFVTINELLAYGMPSDTSSPSAIETTTSSSESSTSATA